MANTTRGGAVSGEYKYSNWLTRTYTVPPALIRYGEENLIALRIWGGDLSFIGNKSGLIKGPLVAELDPYMVRMREPGGEAVPAELFDLSQAQHGRPFEILVPFPAEIAARGHDEPEVPGIGGSRGRIVRCRCQVPSALTVVSGWLAAAGLCFPF